MQGTTTFGRILLKSLRKTVLATLYAMFGFILFKLSSNSDIACLLFRPTAVGAKSLTQLEKFFFMFVNVAFTPDISKPPSYPFALRYLKMKNGFFLGPSWNRFGLK